MVGTHLLVRRERLRECRIVQEPRGSLAAGEVELVIEGFGFTGNNLGYGAMGEVLSYWRFFPTPHLGWGRIPVWGFARVTRSRFDGVTEGERFFGLYPMSSHVVLAPAVRDPVSFTDGSPHRHALSDVYSRYWFAPGDPRLDDSEPHQMLLMPVFANAFLLDDFVDQHRCFGAEGVLLSSASSKTASSAAFLLRRRGLSVTGLTSARNVPFVQRLGVYDRVIEYDALGTLDGTRPIVFLDFAGSGTAAVAVQRHFGAALKHRLAVGTTSSPGDPFFATAQLRAVYERWGADGFLGHFTDAWNAFLGPVRDPARSWIRIVHGRGPAEVEQRFRDVIEGRGLAEEGCVLSLS